MNDDDLARAIAALREEGDRPAPQARLTRERILREIRPRARSRRLLVGIPLAALLLGGSVLAATGRLPEVVRVTTRILGLDEDGAGEASGSGARGAAAAPVSKPSEPLPAEPAALAPALPDPASGVVATTPEMAPSVPHAGVDAGAGRTATRRARLSAAPTNSLGSSGSPVTGDTQAAAPAVEPSAVATPPSAVPDGPDTLALYRRAHQIHFVEQNPARALAAWDAYLASDPHGALAVDARYDRALCLVRLGRKDEARRALEPFAAGKYGAFRKNDASQLIDALNGKTP